MIIGFIIHLCFFLELKFFNLKLMQCCSVRYMEKTKILLLLCRISDS